MKKFISIMIASLMLIFCSVPGYAYADNVITDPDMSTIISPRFIGISLISADLSINSLGRTTCSGSVTPSSDSYTTVLTVKLQKQNGSSWSTIKSWSDTNTGIEGVIIEKHYYVTSGTYRVCSTAKIYNSSGTLLETESIYSAERTY